MGPAVAMEHCEHPSTVLTVLTCSNGTQQYKRHCRRCHQAVGGAVKKAEALRENPYPPPFDVEARERHWRELQERWQVQHRIQSEDAELEQRQWRERYEQHLGSPEWRRAVALVHKRAGGLCEGCLQRPATQTHHLTYLHMGQELMWELVAICDECHRRISEKSHA
uniref:Putative HNH endonuclease n=2 Tax=viral metagenome TaxID=1070528 RepID=A0A6M3J4V1_9ZZZZ